MLRDWRNPTEKLNPKAVSRGLYIDTIPVGFIAAGGQAIRSQCKKRGLELTDLIKQADVLLVLRGAPGHAGYQVPMSFKDFEDTMAKLQLDSIRTVGFNPFWTHHVVQGLEQALGKSVGNPISETMEEVNRVVSEFFQKMAAEQN